MLHIPDRLYSCAARHKEALLLKNDATEWKISYLTAWRPSSLHPFLSFSLEERTAKVEESHGNKIKTSQCCAQGQVSMLSQQPATLHQFWTYHQSPETFLISSNETYLAKTNLTGCSQNNLMSVWQCVSACMPTFVHIWVCLTSMKTKSAAEHSELSYKGHIVLQRHTANSFRHEVFPITTVCYH